MRDTQTRLTQYEGPGDNLRHSNASNIDVLPMAGLAEDKRVEDVLDTNNGYICYTY